VFPAPSNQLLGTDRYGWRSWILVRHGLLYTHTQTSILPFPTALAPIRVTPCPPQVSSA
jgi:hypothetical protein